MSHETGTEHNSEHWVNARISKGKHTIKVEVLNIPTTEGIPKLGEQSFVNNPTGFALVVRYARVIQRTDRTSWKMNPMAGSAILIAPPCPKKISGKGVVTDIIPVNPGVYIPDPPLPGEGYFTQSTIAKVLVTGRNPINYDCTKDKIIIEDDDGNDHGTVLEPICGPFGKLTGVNVVKRGSPWTSWPNIRIESDTGNGATFLPIFSHERVDPFFPTVDVEDLIQVTDLAGLKKTGYYDGRAYYGAVFYEDGVRYAGYYKTTGQKVQIYDTMQESIDAQVTTRPSAIQRSGTDITNNDPRLDIPGTPDTLT